MSIIRPWTEPAGRIRTLSVSPGTRSVSASVATADSVFRRADGDDAHAGFLVVNADDWGRNRRTTAAILNCTLRGAASCVSAMVFMEDSERAAVIAQEREIDAGLHLNLTTSFSASRCNAKLVKHQEELARHLLRGRFAQTVFHPGLIRSFEYVVRTQLDEFRRLYQKDPDRVDGHHHMHLCVNVLLGGLLPSGIVVRRNCSFMRGEKSYANILYRQAVDFLLERKHLLADYFFELQPIEPRRLQRIFGLARRHVVELETHPANPEEYKFLMEGEIGRLAGDIAIAPHFVAPQRALERRGHS